MKCPVCPEQHLNITQRQGVEIDYCPQCRGVWLDRARRLRPVRRPPAGATPTGGFSGFGLRALTQRQAASLLAQRPVRLTGKTCAGACRSPAR